MQQDPVEETPTRGGGRVKQGPGFLGGQSREIQVRVVMVVFKDLDEVEFYILFSLL